MQPALREAAGERSALAHAAVQKRGIFAGKGKSPSGLDPNALASAGRAAAVAKDWGDSTS